MPSASDDISEAGRVFWDKYGPKVNALGLLEELDVTAFQMLCDGLALLKELRAEWATDKRATISCGDNGAEQANPLLGLIASQVKGVLSLLSEFGMTPASRQKLTGSTSATPVDPNADPMAQLYGESQETKD